MIRTSPTSFIAYEAIPAGARVKLRTGSAILVELAVAADQEIGHAILHSGKSSYAANSPIGVALLNQPGTVTALAGGVIAVGDLVYRTAAGKVLATSDGACIGRALEAAAADGDWIEILRDPTVAVTPGDGTATTAKLADGAVTAGKLADAVADKVFSSTVAVADATGHVAAITGAVKDAQGNALAGRFLLAVHTNVTAAYGAPADSGTFAAAANTTLLNELTDDAHALIQTHSDGTWGLNCTLAGAGTIHAHATVLGQFATANSVIA